MGAENVHTSECFLGVYNTPPFENLRVVYIIVNSPYDPSEFTSTKATTKETTKIEILTTNSITSTYPPLVPTTNTNSNKSSNLVLIIGGVIVTIILLAAIVIGVLYLKRRRSSNHLSNFNATSTSYGIEILARSHAQMFTSSKSNFKINENDLEINFITPIGSGVNSVVYKGMSKYNNLINAIVFRPLEAKFFEN